MTFMTSIARHLLPFACAAMLPTTVADQSAHVTAFASTLGPRDMDDLIAYLKTR